MLQPLIGVRGCRHRIYRSADSEVAEQELFPRPSAHVDTEAVLRRTGAVHHLHGQRLDERWSVSIQPKESHDFADTEEAGLGSA